MNVTNVYLSRHEDVKELAERIGKDIGSLELLATTDKENLVAAINEIKQAQSEIAGRIEVLEEYHRTPADQGPASEYTGTGWYKATDTGVVYNVGVPEGETHTFEGDPTEYISVWRNEGFDSSSFTGSVEDLQKLLEWHKNLHRYATSNVTDMRGWAYLYGNVALLSGMGIPPESVITDPLDISHYDTSNVTTMENMFTGAATFNEPLDNFDTTNVTNMGGMFGSASAFNQPLDSFDTSNVTNIGEMFYEATSFNQDISSWDTSNVTGMSSMFRDATSFNQDLSQWCVPLISSSPYGFDGGASSWTLPKPVWGTCPRGEDQE